MPQAGNRNWLGRVKPGRRGQKSNFLKVPAILLGISLLLLGLFLWGKERVPVLMGGGPKPIPKNLFLIPPEERAGQRFVGVVEIGDEYSDQSGRVLSAVLDPGGHQIRGGLRIPKALIPPDLQKGQLYRCELKVDPGGFLVVEKIEKD